ncbi:uncharacterized protein LOC115578354 [Sparus aurata]|uniref:uncharacterized protein LOC115578354 n=1 Tax=Sparus aurata TaxID=8175 RepID=UPI0011C0E2A8|nr:uncharacterized protein LOC115578354 [Sparus aurata]
MERYGESPTSGTKTMLASVIVDQFPCLRDSLGTGFDAWFTPGRNHRPATGFLEERLRNVWKRLRCSKQKNSAEVPQRETQIIVPSTERGHVLLSVVNVKCDTLSSLQQTKLVSLKFHTLKLCLSCRSLEFTNLSHIAESPITGEWAIQMKEWLTNNIWPQSQVVQYMCDAAIHRAQWISSNGTVSIPQIIAEFPCLVDTPGMKEKPADTNLHSQMADIEGDIALLLLPVLLPAAPYKVGRRVFRPSSLESRKTFIDVQLPGTNMVEYLSRAATDCPHVLMLGEERECSQAFVIVNGTA